jgi:NAD-dependent DNA ligase
VEFLIVIAIIVGVIFLLKSGGEPNVENLTVDQMVRHTKSLQNRIDQLRSTPNPSEAVKAEIAQKEAQWNHAMSVWRRKNEEASGS